MMQRKRLTGLIFLFILGFASPLWAQSGASVQYVYDALGRLTTVVDPSGNVATYNYDAVGNLLSITRTTSSPSALAIFGFSPAQGSVGQTVAIQGQNFSATPSANTVQFNGSTATVTAATANSLTTTVPTGATTGLISVTVGTATANSSGTSKRFLLFLGLEHASGDFGYEAARDEAFAVSAKVISEAGDDVAFAGGQSFQPCARDFFRGLGMALEFLLAGNNVEFGLRRARAKRADTDPVGFHLFGKAFGEKQIESFCGGVGGNIRYGLKRSG